MDSEAEAIDDADSPEWSETDVAEAVPFKEAHPEAFAARTRRKGRPPINDRPRADIGFRLHADVVEGVKATGRGDNSRVEKVLRDALAKGLL